MRFSLKNCEATKVVWHLGFQKTATTTIQQNLIDNADLLDHELCVIARGQKGKAIEKAGKRVMRKGRFIRPAWSRRLRFGLEVVSVFLITRFHPRRNSLVSNEVIIGHWVYKDEITIFD